MDNVGIKIKEGGLHLGEEVEKRSWENTVSLFQDIMQRSRDPGEDGASNHPHGVGILVREQSQEGREAA